MTDMCERKNKESRGKLLRGRWRMLFEARLRDLQLLDSIPLRAHLVS